MAHWMPLLVLWRVRPERQWFSGGGEGGLRHSARGVAQPAPAMLDPRNVRARRRTSRKARPSPGLRSGPVTATMARSSPSKPPASSAAVGLPGGASGPSTVRAVAWLSRRRPPLRNASHPGEGKGERGVREGREARRGGGTAHPCGRAPGGPYSCERKCASCLSDRNLNQKKPNVALPR